jgi:hypothetical protein
MRLIGLAVILIVGGIVSPAAGNVPAGKPHTLGVLMSGRSSAFEQELKTLGYVEGQNILIERRYSHGRLDVLDRLARELVEFRPNVIAVSTEIWHGVACTVHALSFCVG